MKKLHQLFDVTDGLPLGELLGFNRGDPAICWYPSAGHDFRHVLYLEHERFGSSGDSRPLIYVFSDMRIKLTSPGTQYPHPPFMPGQLLDSRSAGSTRPAQTGDYELRVSRIEKLRLKHDFYNPSEEVWPLGEDEYSRNVYFLQFEMSSVVRSRNIVVTFPGLYFTYENLNMLVDFFLANLLRVPVLVHICDGGTSFGGSVVPMNFIYQAYRQLGLARVITDRSLCWSRFDQYQDHELLQRRISLRKYHSVKPESFPLVNTSDDSFRRLWTEDSINLHNFQGDESAKTAGGHYEWRLLP